MKHFSVTTLFLGMDAGQPRKKKKKGGNESKLYQQEFSIQQNIN